MLSTSEEEAEEWTASSIFFHLVCPAMGCLLATAMFAAPIADLRLALLHQSLGEDLNPRPWAVMTGNCLGWCAYAYYIHDPFILASNIPGLILSMWLNAGAAKLQYKQMTTTTASTTTSTSTTTTSSRTADPSSALGHRPIPLLHIQNDPEDYAGGDYDYNYDDDDYTNHNDIDGNGDGDAQQHQPQPQQQQVYYNVQPQAPSPPPPIFTPQEIWWLRVLIMWSITLVWVGWISPYPSNEYAAPTIGWLVNLNLIFFYAAPLQTIQEVLRNQHSNSIHRPSMFMACGNATFWLLYGIALWDPILMVPNSIGLTLAMSQVLLCIIYPKKNHQQTATTRRRIIRHDRRQHQASSPAVVVVVDDDDDNDDISMTNLFRSSPHTPPDGLFRDLQMIPNTTTNQKQ